jgi:O-antigen/teichoic acid export membrane protein
MIGRIVDWFRDRAVRKVVRYGIPAAVGKLVSSIAGLVTMALLARQLGPALFGVIAIIRTLVGMVDQYANFNTWQAIIKYGTEAIAAKRDRDVDAVIKLAVIIDVATGAAATILVAGIAFIVPAAFDWSMHEAWLCALYGITLVTRVSGASDGIFRLADAYRAQALWTSVSALLLTGSVAVAVALDASFDGCVYALIVGEVAGNIVLTIVSFVVARRAGYGNWPRSSLANVRSKFPGIVRFLVATNAQLTVKKTNAELDMMMVGGLLGSVSSGLFRVIKQLGTIPGRVFMPFEQVVFTELARAAASSDFRTFRRLLRRFTALVTLGSLAIWAVAAIAAEPLVWAVAGDDFVPAAPAFRYYLLAMVFVIANTPVMRALIALGRPGTLFWAELAALVVLVIALVIGAQLWGLVGVSIAVLLHRVLQMVWSWWLVGRAIREREQIS